jgi:hypothetical protein
MSTRKEMEEQAIKLGLEDPDLIKFKSDKYLKQFIQLNQPPQLTEQTLAEHNAHHEKEQAKEKGKPANYHKKESRETQEEKRTATLTVRNNNNNSSLIKFPTIDTVSGFINQFCHHYIVSEQNLVNNKLLVQLLSKQNKVAEQLNKIAWIIKDQINPLVKLNCFDDEDRKYLGVRAESVLGSNYKDDQNAASDSTNPLIEIFNIQQEIVETLQNIVTERANTLKLENFRYDDRVIDYFQRKQNLLIELFRLQDEKLAFLHFIIKHPAIPHKIFMNASKIMNKKSFDLEEEEDDNDANQFRDD